MGIRFSPNNVEGLEMQRVSRDVHKESRLSIRANEGQKMLLAQAASMQNMNMSQFVLQTALAAASKVVQEDSRIVLSTEEYAWLVKTMDKAPTDAPRLREALAKKPVWDE